MNARTLTQHAETPFSKGKANLFYKRKNVFFSPAKGRERRWSECEPQQRNGNMRGWFAQTTQLTLEIFNKEEEPLVQSQVKKYLSLRLTRSLSSKPA